MGTYESYSLLSFLNLLHLKLKTYKEILLLQESAIHKYEVSRVAYYANLDRQTIKELTSLYEVVTSLEAKYNLINTDLNREIINLRRSIDNLLQSVTEKNLRNQKLIGTLVKKIEKDLLSFRKNQAKYVFALSQSSFPIFDVTV